jgi:hypothetical protein
MKNQWKRFHPIKAVSYLCKGKGHHSLFQVSGILTNGVRIYNSPTGTTAETTTKKG